MRQVVAWTGLLLALACGPKVPPSELYRSGDRPSALEAQKALAQTPGVDQALDNLQLASMALALGDEALAETALRRAVSTMTDFQADGEFAAVVAAESRKEWKGEPYEKMGAYLTLGMLLYARGERGNALAMFKSSVLADTGSRLERFRSDFVPGWLMQALVYQAEGEPENARQFMGRAIDSRWSRHTIHLLIGALEHTTVPGQPTEDVDLARVVLLSAMSAGVTAVPRDPQEAARATISAASTLLLDQRDRPEKERLPGFQDFRRRHFQAAGDALPALADAWKKEVAAIPKSASARGQRFADRLEGLLEDSPNVVLLIEEGRGPRKVQEGRYGEVLKILPRSQREPPSVLLDSASADPLWLDTLSYQATTRGGRGVDSFLKGKAVYKDTSLITGRILLEVAEVMHAADAPEQLQAAAALVGVALMVSGAVTNPEADTRAWTLAPNGWGLVAADLSPGRHTLQVGVRSYTVDVPAHGQLVALVPALPPGGDVTLTLPSS